MTYEIPHLRGFGSGRGSVGAGCAWQGRTAQLRLWSGVVPPGSVEEWAPATVNYPLSTGDHLWTAAEAQAEVTVGLTAVHLAPETGFFISRLDDTAFLMGLAEGALNIRIPRMNEGESFEVETPYGKFRLLATGSYRVDVQPEADYASIVVRAGAAEAVADGQTFAVAAGKRAVLAGKPAIGRADGGAPPDTWDEWCANRDEQVERGYEASQQYVPWEITAPPSSSTKASGCRTRTTAVLGPAAIAGGLGAVPLRLLDLARAVGMDVGRPRDRGASRPRTGVAGAGSNKAGRGCRSRSASTPSTSRIRSRSPRRAAHGSSRGSRLRRGRAARSGIGSSSPLRHRPISPRPGRSATRECW